MVWEKFKIHLKKRETTLCMTFLMGIIITVLTYYFVILIYPLGPIFYIPLFSMYFIQIITIWHYSKDCIVDWWRDYQKRRHSK